MSSSQPCLSNFAGRRFQAFLDLVSKASPELVVSTLPKLFSENNLQREKIEKRIETLMDWRARGGFEIVDVKRSEPWLIDSIVTMPFSGEYRRLSIELEVEEPHLIDAVLLGRHPLPANEQPCPPEAAAQEFITYVEKLATAELFSGAVLIGYNGRILDQAAFGLANRDFDIPNTPSTRFNVASLTKSWTAVAVCQLVEQGCLSFDDPLAKFIDYPDAASAEAIRIKHLLSHTSGLGGYFNDSFYQTPRVKLRGLNDFLALAEDDKPSFAPGAGWKYSNVGVILLGKVIEVITGSSYHDHVMEHVLVRAGMADAGFVELDHVNRNIAVGYHKYWQKGGPVIVNSLFEWAVRGAPDGCGYATTRDIWNFATAFQSGRLVSSEMVQLMTTAKPELSSSDYGYGFAIHPERALYGHSGGLLGASSNLDITCNPDGWIIVVLANDLSMRTPVLKARQIVGVTVPEAEEGRSYLPRAGMTAR